LSGLGSTRLNTSRNFCILRSCSHAVRFIDPAPAQGTKPDNSLAGVAGVYNRAAYAREKATALARWADYLLAAIEGGEPKVLAFPATV